jgi:hypothetical protein
MVGMASAVESLLATTVLLGRFESPHESALGPGIAVVSQVAIEVTTRVIEAIKAEKEATL